MLKFFASQGGLLSPVDFKVTKPPSLQPIWIDIINPTKQEDAAMEDFLGINIPDLNAMGEIELSNRLYHNEDATYVTGSFVTSEHKIQAITFILTGKTVVTLRYGNFPFFERYLQYNKNNDVKGLHYRNVFMDLLETAIGQIADYLEEIGHSIDSSTQVIFRPHIPQNQQTPKINFKQIILQIGNNGDLISKAHESLMSIYRILNFVSEPKNFKLTAEESRKLKILMNDIPPLNDHTSFLSNKINFLLDACLGMINIEQNRIIKIVSVAALIFFPPTLIASIYGMNFEILPELKWAWGYPFALLSMLLAGLLPYIFFKLKNWI